MISSDQDVVKRKQQSPYYNWFKRDPQTEEVLHFLQVDDLIKVDLTNDDAAGFIIDAASYWVELGVDGLRIDHVIGVDHTFWPKFSFEIHKVNPSLVIFGEAFPETTFTRLDIRTLGIPNAYEKFSLLRFLSRFFLTKPFAKDVIIREYLSSGSDFVSL